jgi:hypothetical protein
LATGVTPGNSNDPNPASAAAPWPQFLQGEIAMITLIPQTRSSFSSLTTINNSLRARLGSPARSRVLLLSLAVFSLVFAAISAGAQTRKPAAAAPAGDDESALFKDYRGVQLGMTADEVRKKLGEPKDKSDEQDFFVFNDNETAQIVYDKTKKVITISADYLTVGSTVPTAKQVFGSEVEAKADGAIYKMLRFTKSGYWLSYNRTGGASPLTTITLQKIQ